ncbi:NB-ARC domain-containing protein [Acaryochloris marina NIES-2412]|uniref:NB-ARC domain-containing protein n=1 Tax=Acaryochloris marina TaxID=155978 RepID=UPI004059B648
MGKRRALLIGVPEYLSSQIESLPVVHQDLDTLETSLRKSNYDVTVVGREGAKETSRSQVLNQLRKSCRQAKGVETLFLYLSGHGLHYNGRDYLVPADASIDDPEDLEDYLVSLDLGVAIDECPAQTIVMVIDACREGVKLQGSKSVSLGRWSGGDRRQAAKRNLAVVFSCSQGQFSHFLAGEQGFSLFTHALANVLEPEHPACTILDVFDATQEQLNELSQEHHKSQQEIRIFQEFGANRDEQHRIICEGIPPEGSETISDEATFQATPLVPWQMPAIPTTFVPRPEHSDELKRRLLSENKSGTLVVSAIYGLGGIGKSVLATVLAHDLEVRQRFADGVLWVTLGQNPDLQRCLGDWIQALRDFDYKPTTLGAASAHLRTLLFEKRMLLVVDDVWQSDHLEPFRVGGEACRVLVTTREAVIADADRYDLDVMTEDQSLSLVEGGMNRSLKSSERSDVLGFVQAVGRLPLALELAAVQVNDGFSWQELLSEFKQEVADLELLDSTEVTQNLAEEKLRKHSLRACFNLSLRRLPLKLLEHFAWLGVLPEDVLIAPQMSATLWGISRLQAKKVLQTLRNRAFLTLGPTVQGSEQTYRLHDLMHDTARWLITRSREIDLPGLGLSLPQAHQQFLERYRQQTGQGQWHTLKGDGYIHAHLTWHMEQAGCFDDIHALLRETPSESRNGWYEACDALGQPAIFVTDLSRAWRVAEELYSDDALQSIVLQVRYALTFASLQSLIGNIPAELMAALVEKHQWSSAQALAYAQQTTDSSHRSRIIQKLARYLPSALLPAALELVCSIQDSSDRAMALRSLAPYLPENLLGEVLEMVRGIKSGLSFDSALSGLVPYLSEDLLNEALELARGIESASARASALSILVPYRPTVVSEILELLHGIESESACVASLLYLAPYLSQELLGKALELVREIKSDSACGAALRGLAPHLPEEMLGGALEVVCDIQDDVERAFALGDLAPYLSQEFLGKALELAHSIESDSTRAYTLGVLAPHLPEVVSEVLELVHGIQDKSARTDVLLALVPHLPEVVSEALELVRSIQDESVRVTALRRLVPHLPEGLLSEALELVRSIQDESACATTLHVLVPYLSEGLLSKALEVARDLQDGFACATALRSLIPHLPEVMNELLEVVRRIQFEHRRADTLRGFVSYLPESLLNEALGLVRSIQDNLARVSALGGLAPYLPEELLRAALELACGIHDDSYCVYALSTLIPHLPEVVNELLELAFEVQDESARASILSDLASQLSPSLLSKALELACRMESDFYRAYALGVLVPYLPKGLLIGVLGLARGIQDESARVHVLSRLAPHFPGVGNEVLELIRGMGDESTRATALSDLVPYVQKGALSEALKLARGIESEFDRAAALSVFVPYVPKVVSEVLELARGIESESARVSALNVLAPHLTEELLNEALELVRGIQEDSVRVNALCVLAPYLPEELLGEALEIARRIESEVSRVTALSALVPCLPEVVSEALEIARRIESEVSRVTALSVLAPHLPEVVSEALELARGIKSESVRASALSSLISQLTFTSKDYLLWSEIIHALSYRGRREFLINIPKLFPSMIELSDRRVMPLVVKSIREVCQQWP